MFLSSFLMQNFWGHWATKVSHMLGSEHDFKKIGSEILGLPLKIWGQKHEDLYLSLDNFPIDNE